MAKIAGKKRQQRANHGVKGEDANLGRDFNRDLKVDRGKFEGIVKSLLNAPPTKREDVKISKKKPQRLIPPQK